jgi:hypothetical protein
MVWGWLQGKNVRTYLKKITYSIKVLGVVSEVVEHLHEKHEVLSSQPTTAQTKQNKKESGL